MQVSLSSGNYDIISNGQAFLFGLNKDFRINVVADNNFEFSVVMKFKKDNYGNSRIDKKLNDNTIVLTCFNFDDMGTGLTKPFSLARIEGKELFLMFWSYLEGSENGAARSVKYTIFMSKKNGEDSYE